MDLGCELQLDGLDGFTAQGLGCRVYDLSVWSLVWSWECRSYCEKSLVGTRGESMSLGEDMKRPYA